jgi:hypothetical protein
METFLESAQAVAALDRVMPATLLSRIWRVREGLRFG